MKALNDFPNVKHLLPYLLFALIPNDPGTNCKKFTKTIAVRFLVYDSIGFPRVFSTLLAPGLRPARFSAFDVTAPPCEVLNPTRSTISCF